MEATEGQGRFASTGAVSTFDALPATLRRGDGPGSRRRLPAPDLRNAVPPASRRNPEAHGRQHRSTTMLGTEIFIPVDRKAGRPRHFLSRRDGGQDGNGDGEQGRAENGE